MPDTSKSIAIVIPNLNGKKFLKDVLDSINNQTYKDVTTVIVDNGSTDGSVEYLRKKYPEVVIVANETNLGFTAVNQGIRAVEAEYYFILNNDTVLNKRLLGILLAFMRRTPNAGQCQPKMLSLKEKSKIDSVGHKIYKDGMGWPGGKMEPADNYTKVEEILLPSGCATFIRKEVLDEIGLYDEDFFAYHEDIDLGFRARLAGWDAYLVPNAFLYHYGSATTGYATPMKAFYVERNRLLFVMKCLPFSMLLLNPFYSFTRYLLQLYAGIRGIGLTGDYVKNQSAFSLVWILIKVHFSALRLFPRMLRKRRIIYKNKKVDNKTIKSWFKKWGLTRRELVYKN